MRPKKKKAVQPDERFGRLRRASFVGEADNNKITRYRRHRARTFTSREELAEKMNAGVYEPRPEKRAPARPARLLALLACVGVFIYAGVSLIRYAGEYAASQDASAQLRAINAAAQLEETQPPAAAAPTDAPSASSADTAAPLTGGDPTAEPTIDPVAAAAYPDNPNYTIQQRFLELRKKNSDIVGWLTIDGVVDEAVVKRNNAYYLTHDYLGRSNANGALFMDERCSLIPMPEMLLIHGHNMKTGAMFGMLKHYKTDTAAYVAEHGLAQFDTLYENAAYVLFAVMSIDTEPDKEDFFNYSAYTAFDTDTQFNTFIERVRRYAFCTVHIDIAPGDRLLMLSTCDNPDESKRLVLILRKVRESDNMNDIRYALNHVSIK